MVKQHSSRIRDVVIDKLHDFSHKKVEKKQFEVDLLNMYRTTKLFCNENSDIILTKAMLTKAMLQLL